MNFIVLMSDTLRSDHLQPYGNKWVQTPYASEFAKSAAMFDSCWAGSFPTLPNRLDLFTGRYGEPIHAWLPLPYGETTLPEVMRKNGYITSLICDTPHLINGGHNFDFPFHQWEFIRGQEVDRFGMDDKPVVFPFKDGSNVNVKVNNMHTAQYFRNTRGRLTEEDWATRKTFDTAVRWLEKNARQEKFFLWIDGFDPHEPQLPPKKYVDMYDKDYDGQVFLQHVLDGNKLSPEELHNVRARYAGTVTFVDRMFGRLMEALEDLKLADDTCIVWVSDHGTQLGEHGKVLLKQVQHNESARTHLMIRTPNRDGAGKHFNDLVQPCDLAPTLLEMAGLPVPERMHGKSYLPLLQGKPFEAREVAITGHAGTNRFCGGKFPMVARDERFTLVDFPDPAKRQLFDHNVDPEQNNNIISEHPNNARRLHEAVLEFLRTHEAQPQLIKRFETGDPGDMSTYKARPAGLEAYDIYFWNILDSQVLPDDGTAGVPAD